MRSTKFTQMSVHSGTMTLRVFKDSIACSQCDDDIAASPALFVSGYVNR